MKQILALTVLLALAATAEPVLASGPGPDGPKTTIRLTPANPSESVVDFLKARGRPSDITHRRTLYAKHFGPKAAESYTGSAKQNIELLVALAKADQDAAREAKEAATRLRVAQPSQPSGKPITSRTSCPAYVLAEGLGVHGSYAFEVTVRPDSNGRIRGQDVIVTVSSAAAHRGSLSFSGTVDIHLGSAKGKSVGTFKLTDAWFPTIGAKDSPSVTRYGQKDRTITLTPGQTHVAVVSLNPVVKIGSSTVPLWRCTADVTIPVR